MSPLEGPPNAPLVSRLLPGNALTRGSASARWENLSLAAIVALAAFLRLWQVGESLWIDELHTSWVVSGSFSDVLPRAAIGNQSPLYFWGMWLWVQIAGQSEWTLRSPSLVAGIALPVAVYGLASTWSRPAEKIPLPLGEGGGRSPPGEGVAPRSIAALAAALLVAIDPTCIFFAQEARPYAWVMLLAVVELALVRWVIERPTLPRRVALVTNSLLLFYLHFTAAIFLIGIVVLVPVLVHLSGSQRRYGVGQLAIDLIVAALLSAPGVVQMAEIFERRANWEAFVHSPSWAALITAVPFTGWALLGAALVLLAQLGPRVLPATARTRGSASTEVRLRSHLPLVWYCLLVAAVMIPLLFAFGASRLDAAPIYYVRYLVALVPLAAAATCLATCWLPWRGVQFAALAALAGWHLYDGQMLQQFARDGRFLAVRNEDWRGAIAFLQEQVKQDNDSAIVFCEPGLIEEPTITGARLPNDYELFAVTALYPFSRPGLGVWNRSQAFLGEMLVAGNWKSTKSLRPWYVVRGNSLSARQLAQRLEARCNSSPDPTAVEASLVEAKEFGNVKVMRFEARRPGQDPTHAQPE